MFSYVNSVKEEKKGVLLFKTPPNCQTIYSSLNLKHYINKTTS